MNKKLYIIGNGFDLHHYLKTSYYDFAKYLKVNHSDTYDILESYVSYPNSEDDLWSHFEENLANLDAKEILSEHSDTLPDYSSDEFRDRDRHVFPSIMEEHYQKLTGNLFKAFEEFIQQVEFPNYAFEHKVLLDKEARFLNFNYTNTLEQLYNIDKKQILFIHNSTFYGNEGIILGHGIDPTTFEEKRQEPPTGLNLEEIEEWHDRYDDYDYSYDTGKENLMCYFRDTYKPTNDIIKKHSAFFEKLNDIDEVFVLGHSISTVDLPYFVQIANSVRKGIHWSVSYYNLADRERHLNTLQNLTIDKSNITLIDLIDLQEDNKQLKINWVEKTE